MLMLPQRRSTAQSARARKPATPSLASSCPRFSRCSASFCPVAGGVHLVGEATCWFLRETAKPGGRAKIDGTPPENLAGLVLSHAARLLSQRSALGKELRRAQAAPSKLDAMRRLREAPPTYRLRASC
jgi:hypothetical protein